MDEKELDVEKLKEYWLTEAEEALQVADHLVEKGDFSYALFFGHLAAEKLLKGLYVVLRGEHAPPIHNLLRARARISSQSWRLDLVQIWPIRLSKTAGIASYFEEFANEASVKDGLKLRCQNVKLFLREP